jgi:two-component system cell cycle sensor histidine kinase/response regulator CckA
MDDTTMRKGSLNDFRAAYPGPGVSFASRFCRVLGMVLVICQILVSAGLATTPKNPHVLILISYHQGFAWSDAEESGFLQRLREVYPKLDVPIEFLDAKRGPGEKCLARMQDFLIDKYRGKKFDLIVAFDNPAMAMLTRYRHELFPDVPVVFAGINDIEHFKLDGRRGITGVAETQDIKKTLELALSLHPRTKQILVINDYTVSGLAVRRDLEPLVQAYADRVKISFIPPSTFEEAKIQISSLPGDALVLIESFATDRLGHNLSLAESTAAFSSVSRVPVYGVHETRLGHGIVGGYLLGGRAHGRRAADIALRVLAGEDPNAIPVDTKSTARPMFDYPQLQRFGISLENLPENSLIINKPESILDRYRNLVIGTLVVVVFLVVLVISLIVSIIRRKLAEKTLRRYERIVSTSQDLMALINRDYVYEAVNDSFLTAHHKAREEILGRTVLEIMGEDVFRDKIQSRLDQALLGQMVHYQAPFVLAGSGRRIIEVSYFPMFDEKGNVEGVVLNGRDITETQKLEEQLLQAQKIESIGTLAGGVAHEINNPINGIMNYAELILDRMAKDSPAREYAQEILHETQRIAKIVKNLLTFARHEKQSHSPAQLSDIISSVLSLIQTVMRHDQIDLELSIPEDLPKIKCRSQQIQQVLMNLMTNARDALNERYPGYNPEKRLRVFAELIEKQDRKFIRTTVEDSGTGIPVEIADRIFDPFFTTKPKETGTGLGLSISYGIVKDHGGELSVKSEPGQYTRFYMDLPVDNGWKITNKLG